MKMWILGAIFFGSMNLYSAQSNVELARSHSQPHIQQQSTTLQKTSSIIVHVVQSNTTIKRAQSATHVAHRQTSSSKGQERGISDTTIREVSSEPGSPTYSADSWVKVLRCPGEKICPRCFAGELCERSLHCVASFVQKEPFDTTSTEFAS